MRAVDCAVERRREGHTANHNQTVRRTREHGEDEPTTPAEQTDRKGPLAKGPGQQQRARHDEAQDRHVYRRKTVDHRKAHNDGLPAPDQSADEARTDALPEPSGSVSCPVE